MISFRNTAKFDQDVTLILITEEQIKKNAIKNLNWASLEAEANALAKTEQFSGKTGEIFPLSSNQQLVVLVGLGKEDDVTSTALRIAIRKALISNFLKKAKSVEIVSLQKKQDDASVIAVIEGIKLGTYSWKKYKSTQKEEKPKSYTIVAPDKKAYQQAVVICDGVNLTRDLVNDNADVTTAEFMEKTIKDLCKGVKNVTLEVLGRKELKEKGLGLHLAVNQGSNKEPRLIIARYKGCARADYDAAFIGKGITFDSGGINLKPSGYLECMKMDMAGSAAVVGVLKNCITLQPKKNFLFVCALAENAIGPGSYKPGDVVKGFAGKTVEIGNTDAEGRLVLADALSYVNKKYKPKALVDLATLTGACIVALGNDYTALLSNNDRLAERFLNYAQKTDDRAWQLPLYKELKGRMDSDIADLKNISNIKGAGTITAAYFLEQFVDDTPWLHLDIAGSAYVEKGTRLYFGSGATGAGVRLLTEFIRS